MWMDGRENSDVIKTRVRRYNWSKAFLMMTWLTAAFTICLYVFSNKRITILISTSLYTLLLLYYVTKAEFTTRRVQETLTKDSGAEIYQDEDEHWILGMFYYNPNDAHILVNNRVGMNMSMNMAKPAAKILMILSVTILLLSPGIGIWLMAEEFTPIKPLVTGSSLHVIHWKEEYTLDRDSIQELTLIETLPKYSKLFGTDMSHLLKGTFDVSGIGKCRLYLNPQKPPFIKIKTKDETIIIGASQEDETLLTYEALINAPSP